MKLLKISIGVIVGLVVGAIFGTIAAILQMSPPWPGPGVGYDVISVVEAPVFQAVVLLCILGFGYLFSLIGRHKHLCQV
jgi:hypothetical protein